MARRDKEPTEPTEDENLLELDGEYEFAGEKYGPGRVRIESRQARRAILRAMENAREEREASIREAAP